VTNTLAYCAIGLITTIRRFYSIAPALLGIAARKSPDGPLATTIKLFTTVK
jgi:hypothetical protein